MSQVCVCDTYRTSERCLQLTPYTYGHCTPCKTRINEKVPRCFSCDTNPAPPSGKVCRGCIRRTRREFSKNEKSYGDALTAHREWKCNLTPNDYTHYALNEEIDGSTKLDSPRRKDYYYVYPPPITAWDVTHFLKDNPNFLWG